MLTEMFTCTLKKEKPKSWLPSSAMCSQAKIPILAVGACIMGEIPGFVG